LRSCLAAANNSHSNASSGSIQCEKIPFVIHPITHLNSMTFASTKSKAVNTMHFIQRTLNWWNSSADDDDARSKPLQECHSTVV
jgi:hypothetical protein